MTRRPRFSDLPAFVLGGLLLAAIVYTTVKFVATLVFTVFLYYASRPIYRRLESATFFQSGLGRTLPYPRTVRAVTTIVLFLMPFLALLLYTLILIVPAVQGFFGTGGAGAAYLQALSEIRASGPPSAVAELNLARLQQSSPAEVADLLSNPEVSRWASGLVSGLSESVTVFGALAIRAFILLAGVFYLLVDGPRLVNWILDRYDQTGLYRQYAQAVDRELSSILFGNILNAVLTGIIAVIIYSAFNLFVDPSARVPFPVLVGALTGAGSLIPVIGMKIVYIPVALLMAITGYGAGGGTAVAVSVVAFLVISFVLVDTIPDFVIRPYVSGKSTHVGALMFAYVFGPLVFGIYGIFLGPIVLVLTAQFVRLVLPVTLGLEEPPTQATLDAFESDVE